MDLENEMDLKNEIDGAVETVKAMADSFYHVQYSVYGIKSAGNRPSYDPEPEWVVTGTFGGNILFGNGPKLSDAFDILNKKVKEQMRVFADKCPECGAPWITEHNRCSANCAHQ